MLVGWVEAMDRKIGGRGIVEERIQRSNGWIGAKEIEERIGRVVVERRVYGDCQSGGQEKCRANSE